MAKILMSADSRSLLPKVMMLGNEDVRVEATTFLGNNAKVRAAIPCVLTAVACRRPVVGAVRRPRGALCLFVAMLCGP